ncbi:MAG: family 16 glycoside hydrolase [Gemmataceae bacterium]
MFRSVSALLLPPLLLLVLAADDKPTSAVKADDGFVSLFDGKTLNGWVPVNAAPGTFFVKEGMLITTGVPTGFLRSEKRYENFILECEYMHMKPKGNSGIFVWADPMPAVGTPFTRAIEVQVLDGLETPNYTSHGDVFAIWGATLVPDRPHPAGWMRCLPSEKRAKPAGQWNHYRIDCNDGTIQLAVNGKVVSGGTKANPRFGYLALEAEGSECRYRNLRIKELPSTRPKPQESSPEARGHRTLFTGLDLKGWEAISKEEWKVNPGANILACVAKKGSSIKTETAYQEYELLFDAKIPLDRKVMVYPCGMSSLPVPLVGDKATANKWRRFTITRRKDHLEIHEQGKPPTRLALAQAKPVSAEIALKVDGPTEFTNLFLRLLAAKSGSE